MCAGWVIRYDCGMCMSVQAWLAAGHPTQVDLSDQIGRGVGGYNRFRAFSAWAELREFRVAA